MAKTAAKAEAGQAEVSAAEAEVHAAQVVLAKAQFEYGAERLAVLRGRLADTEAGAPSGGAYTYFGQLVAAEIAGLTQALQGLIRAHGGPAAVVSPAQADWLKAVTPTEAVSIQPASADIPELPPPAAAPGMHGLPSQGNQGVAGAELDASSSDDDEDGAGE